MKKEKGITLIALIITVIVLAILVGTTLARVNKKDGVIKKTREAKEAYKYATSLEEIKLQVSGSYDSDLEIDIETLNEALLRIKGLTYKDKPINTNISNENYNKINSLPATVKLNGYKFDIYEDGTVDYAIEFDKLRKMYGTVVSGYGDYESSTPIEWKLLYVDEKNREAFLMSSSYVEYIGLSTAPSQDLGKEYSGLEDIKNSTVDYGRKYNGLWIEKCTGEDTRPGVKGVAFLCDTNKWKKYCSNKAKYVVGAPTFEMIIASYYDKQIKDFKDEEYDGPGADLRNATEYGYVYNNYSNLFAGTDVHPDYNAHSPEEYEELLNKYNVIATFYRLNINNDSKYYWLASPTHNSGSEGKACMRVNGNGIGAGNCGRADWQDSTSYIRPVACVPVSSLVIENESLSIK